MNLPNDPIMLMSVINTKLRDSFSSLDELAKTLCIDKDALVEKLEKAGFKYNEQTNQFR